MKLDANAQGRRRRRKYHSMEITPMFWCRNSNCFAIKRLNEQIDILIISVNELKSENTIFDKLSNEVMLNLYMFCSRMLNKIFRDVNGTGIVTIDDKMFLMNTIIKDEFLHLQKLDAIATENNVFSLSGG